MTNQINKLRFSLLGTAFMLSSVNIFAQTSGTCGDGVNWAITGTAPNQTLTISYAGSGTGVMNDYTFGTAPWYSQVYLTTLVIDSGVTSIGNCAFRSRSGLTSVTIPNSVTTIGMDAFSACSGLTSVSIGNSVTTIGNSAFSGCVGLTSITIPNSVTTIGNWAFSMCGGLTSVTIGNSVASIGNCAFFDCSNLTSIDVDVSNSRYSSNNGIIYSKLQDTLLYCPQGKTGTVIIPNSVTSIGDSAFLRCSGLTSVTIGNSVTSIGGCAFFNCWNLTFVTIGNSVTSIGDKAFYQCSKLTSVSIPNSVTSIGDYAFSGCSGLYSITTHAIIPPILGSYAFSSVSPYIPVYIPCGRYNSYRSANGWNYFSNFITNNGGGTPTIDTTFYNAAICYGLSYSDSNFTNLTQSGDYQIILQNVSGCEDSVVILLLDVKMPPLKQELCMISVDENNHNELVWKVKDEVVSYNLYREGDISGQYDLIANIDSNSQNRWVDTASNAKIRSYRYKVSGIDTCGQESELSTEHKTMHLTISAGMNNSWNLIWTAYEGTQYSTYNIYRTSGNKPGPWVLIETMPSGNTSYSDFSAPNGNFVYYMVEIMLDEPCVLHKSLSAIKSNVATNNTNVGVVETRHAPALRIYPNPTTGKLSVFSSQLSEMGGEVEVFDVVGRKLLSHSPLTSDSSPLIEIDISHLANGLYFLKIDGKMFKVVKQ